MARDAGETPKLPRFAALFLLLMKPPHRDLFVGDLLEEYQVHVLPSRGHRAARRWMWGHLLRGTTTAAVHRIYDRLAGRTDGGPKGDNHRGRGGMGMGSWTQDLRIAGRNLARRPGFALGVVLTLGLGIGATACQPVNGI